MHHVHAANKSAREVFYRVKAMTPANRPAAMTGCATTAAPAPVETVGATNEVPLAAVLVSEALMEVPDVVGVVVIPLLPVEVPVEVGIEVVVEGVVVLIVLVEVSVDEAVEVDVELLEEEL